MLNDKDTQDLIKFLTLMGELNSDAEGRKILSRIEYLELMAFEVALKALTTPIVARDVSEEDLEKALNEVSPYFLINTGACDASDDKLLGEVKMTMPTTEPHRCNHIWWWNQEAMKCICSKCHIKISALDMAGDIAISEFREVK
ncbi:MAG: hypothetical protein E5Y74_00025 [Mesorhizobium sp.]|nr:MAG: hypothetical protein E5Y74_00025 [Mesorhizobium sp.]